MNVEEEAPPVGAPGADAETARTALLLASRLLGTNAARVEHAERKSDQALELLGVLTQTQKNDALILVAAGGRAGR